MKIIFIIAGIIVFSLLTFILYRYIRVKNQHKLQQERRFARIKSLVEKVEASQHITEDDVLPLAENIQSREITFQYLSEINRTELFPQSYYTIERAAESNLANWLEFPTELDAYPDHMEHMKKVIIPFDHENNVYYHVFKFAVNEPHWAAKEGWMLGVVGPFFDDSKPYDFPAATFSRFSSKYGTVSPEEEAKWVHENIAMKK